VINQKLLMEKIKDVEGLLVPGQEKTLYTLAAHLSPNSVIVEIGSFKGRSTACMALGSLNSTKIFAIDTFAGNKRDFTEGVQFEGGNFYQTFENNMRKLGVFKKISPIIGLSSKIGLKWKTPIDMLFVDGSHIYEDVKMDFQLFFPWVKPGGLIVFHDVSPDFPGVFAVWNNIAKKKLLNIGNFHSLFYGYKPSASISKELNRVFVIIPVHNDLKLTKICLRSMAEQRYKKLTVIVVDDGSTDGTFEYITRNYPHWEIIRGNGNWWWARSMHAGVERVLKIARKGDFILSMNNDCYFDSNYVAKIVKTSTSNGRAIVGSLILDSKNHKKVVDAGVKIDWAHNMLIYGIADKISSDIKFYTDRLVIRDVDTLPGKGSLIPVEVFEKIGNFNYKRLPHYISDYEYFCRAKRNGFELIVGSDARLFNFVHQTGTEHLKTGKYGKLQIFHTLFARKSKNNILDHLNFTLLCCPKEYLLTNLWHLFMMGLFFHNLYIYVWQNPIVNGVRLLVHNIPILIRQSVARLIPDYNEPISYDYQIIPKSDAENMNSSWLDEKLPIRQWKVVSGLMSGGDIPQAALPVIVLLRGLEKKKMTLLDAGCSSGFYNDFFVTAGLDIVYQGCDFAPKFIKLAQELHPLLKFKVCSLTNLEYETNSFDVVLVSGSLHYVTDYELAFKEISRVSLKFVLLHRLPMFIYKRKTQYFSKKSYGVKMMEIVFDPEEISKLCKQNHLIIKKKIWGGVVDIGKTARMKAKWATLLLEKEKE